MSKPNKYAQTDIFTQNYEVTAKSLKHMNDALMERIKAGVDLIAVLKEAIVELQARNQSLNDELLLLRNGKESVKESSGNLEEGKRKVSSLSETKEEEKVMEMSDFKQVRVY
jgi:FtsZ-binding cell division protein ZapB